MASEELIEFPKGFLIGTGSGAFQVEGGWNADGKSPSIWDDYFHSREVKVVNPYLPVPKMKKSYSSLHRGVDLFEQREDPRMSIINGDIACDSYNKVDEDVKNLVELGVNFYRFSISWPRVLPAGDDRNPNEEGVKYYKTLIEKLLENNIQPMITMYHWDLPTCLQVLGGWANPYIVSFFSNYANFLYKTFGDQVKLWSTINEPRFVAQAYGTDKGVAPAIGEEYNGIGEYMVIRNVLLAHASAYRIYEKTYKAQQQGEISLCLDTMAYLPEDPSNDEHHTAVTRSFDFSLGIFTQPLLTGEFPKTVVDRVQEISSIEKINLERLFEFTEFEKKLMIDAYDFIAFNYYTSFKIRPMFDDEYAQTQRLFTKDMGIVGTPNADLGDTFRGFTQVVNWFVKNCKNPKLFLTENGTCESPNNDQSELKIKFHRGILTEVNKALNNGVNIAGYGIWSFMDSLEWTSGYFDKLYGIYKVDFNDPKRPRSKKPSFGFFQKLFKTKTVQALAYE